MIVRRNALIRATRIALVSIALALSVEANPGAKLNDARSAYTKPEVSASQVNTSAQYERLALSFEPNQGQTSADVKFLARGHGYSLFLAPTEAVVVLTRRKSGSAVTPVQGDGRTRPVEKKASGPDAIPLRMELSGANRHPRIEGVDLLSAKTNYYRGRDPRQWRVGVPNFARVRYRNVYRDVDLVFYGNPNQLEYDFLVAPGGDPDNIKLAFAGADKLDINAEGNLVVRAKGEQVVLRKPTVYQEGKDGRRNIDGTFARLDASTVAFRIGVYDRSQPLVIDPTLVWAQIIRGNFLDVPEGIAVDSNDNPYVAGLSCSSDYPVTATAGPRTGCDAFVTKLDANSGTVVWSSIFGGSSSDQANGVAVDQSGAVYVTGQTASPDFPGTSDPFLGTYDAFVTQLNSNGTLAWSRLIGGSNPINGGALGTGWTYGFAVAVPQGCAPNCSVYFAGQSTVADLPTTNGAFQASAQTPFAEAFLGELGTGGTPILYLSYFGGGPTQIFGQGGSTWFTGIAVDHSGKAYAAGGADLETAPVTLGSPFAGTVDALVAKFDPSRSGSGSLLWARYLGGSGYDRALQIALDPGCASGCSSYVGGVTYSHDFPATAGAYQSKLGGNSDAFVTKLDSNGGVSYSTYVGDLGTDSANAIGVDSSGSPYIVGTSEEFYPSVNQLEGLQPPDGILLQSTNGGASFGATGYPTSASAIGFLRIDPNDPNVVLAGTQRSGIQKSTDGGASFSATNISTGLTSVFADPTSSQTVYAGTLSGLFKSTDGGNTFNPTSFPAAPFRVAVDPNDPSKVYVGTGVVRGTPTAGQVFQSTDGATTFTAMPGLSVASVFALAVDPNDDTVYAGTSSGLFQATHFAQTGSLNIPRSSAAGALLQDGRYLIAGGIDANGNVLASVELYNPTTGAFTLDSQQMTTRRQVPMVATLPNGKVLIAGGCTAVPGIDDPTATTEIYDPVADTFTPASNLLTPKCGGIATVLNNGKVLIISGPDFAELFDPSPGGVPQLVPYSDPNYNPSTAVTRLANGKVLVAGGTLSGNVTNVAEIYDPTSGSFSTTGPMNTARLSNSAVLLPGNQVLVAGGNTNGVYSVDIDTASAEIFDGVSSFHNTGSMLVPRDNFNAVGLADGRVLVVGGRTPPNAVELAEIYDPNTGVFSGAGNATAGFDDPQASVLLQNGNVLITAGNEAPGGAQGIANLYDPNTFGFQPVGPRYSYVNAVAVDSTTIPSTVYAGIVNGIVESQDGFASWNYVGNALLAPFFSLAVDQSTSPAKLYGGDSSGELLTSIDGGNTFTLQNILGFNPGNVVAIAAPSNAAGTVYVAPYEEFDTTVTKLSPDFSSLLFSSFLGGTAGDFGQGIAVGLGGTYVTGGTGSSDFPSAGGELEGRDNVFVAKLPNTLAGSDETVQPNPGTSVTFPTVTSGGNTVASTSTIGPALPPGFELVGSYTDIATTAKVKASPFNPITVCFNYSNSGVADPGDLDLLHFQGGVWVNVTTTNNTRTGIICGAVTSLSPFAVVKQVRPQNKDDCKEGEWERWRSPQFKNQGDCISFCNHR